MVETDRKNENLLCIEDGKGKEDLIRWQKTDLALTKIKTLAAKGHGDYVEDD